MAPTRVTHPPDDRPRRAFPASEIEGFGVGTWDLDLTTRELEWSETARILFGVEPGQPASYDLFLSLLEPERPRARSRARSARVSERGGSFDVSFKVAGASGRGNGSAPAPA